MKTIQRLKKIHILMWIIGIVFFCTVGCAEEKSDDLKSFSLEKKAQSSEECEEESLQDQSEENTTVPKTIYVYVCGAVEVPGVYEVDVDARVYEAIACAGGLREDAEPAYVNQAQILSDGEQIYIPTQEEVEKGGFNTQKEASVTGIAEEGKIDINTATKEELMTLSGIGASRAERIIAYREAQGAFQKVEDLMNVEGIKEGIFQKIKDSITVNTGS